MNISSKLLLSLLGTALVPLIILSVIAYVSLQRTLLRAAEENLHLDSMAYANTVMVMVEQARDEVDSWSKLETLQGVFTGEDLDLRMGLLLRNLSESEYFREIWCLDTTGKVVASSNFYRVGELKLADPGVVSVLEGQPYMSDIAPYTSAEGDEFPGLAMGVPVYGAFDEETIIGGVMAFYNWDTVLNLTRRLDSAYQNDYETIELLREDGTVIASANRERLFHPYDSNQREHQQNVVGTAVVTSDALSWTMRARAEMDRGKVLTAVSRLRNVMLAGVLLILLAVVIVSYWLAMKISRPIVRLSHSARQIAEGKLDNEAKYDAPDEIGQLARDLDLMRRNLKDQIDHLDTLVLKRTHELEETVTKLRLEISEREAAEELAGIQQQQLVQADKMVSLGTLVAGVAHEINNPNGLIALNLSILRLAWQRARPILDDYAEENGDFSLGAMNYSEMKIHMERILGEMQTSSDRIKLIVSDLKEFGQKRSDQAKESISINDVVESAVTLVRNHLEKCTDSLDLALDADVPPVAGVFQRLEQVVVNLLLNAGEALPDSSCPIVVRTGYNTASQCVFVTVEDGGTGISNEDLPYIMDPFFTTKRDSGGTGLGLSVSASIVEEHGGALSFQSVSGEGTVVTMSIPAMSNSEALS